MAQTEFPRRTFVNYAMGATGSVALAGLLSSCGPSGSSSASGEPAEDVQLISIGNSEGDPANLDTGMQNTFANLSTVGSACHAYLLYLAVDGSLQPDLAIAHEAESPTQLRFDLREGVQFHNGREMVAKDVVESFQRLMDPDAGSPYAAQLEPVQKIDVIDDYTVVFNLSRPYAPLLGLCSQIPIIPIETADTQATDPVGAGPFEFMEWEVDNYMAFSRFEDYYDSSFPQVPELHFLSRPDPTALRSGFQSGESSAIAGFAWPELETLAAIEGASTGTSYINGFNFISFNCRVEPFNDARVRKAFSLALNRKPMAEAANGPGSNPAHVLIASNSPYYPESLEVPFDVEQARELLAEAGVTSGYEVEALIPDIPLLRPLQPVWQAQMAEVGINLSTRMLPVADYVSRVFTNFDFSLGIAGDSSAPDPALFLDRYLMTDGASNHMGYSNSELDKLLVEASSTFDEAERKELYRKAMEIVVDEVPMTPFIQIPVNTAVYPEAESFAIRPNYLFEVRSIGS